MLHQPPRPAAAIAMENNSSPYQLIDNPEKKQYEFHLDNGLVPRIEYIKVQGKI